ncbi:MFS transporter [Actinomadura citrea]|uniref:EmrB/QacA subfamily drug resistance transporter n=1 Tax=Actinomadura citrea TaxID=46158 RepID=A0A7Y9G849_9ACTN|nr:MFS transporter [Actinomadura citrea]NYE11730.1 EmrB/QacA subfamily drug resistance transporter [Actinomadura citrea]GGT91818.1 MFS transporter [Actinomadura citrea]
MMRFAPKPGLSLALLAFSSLITSLDFTIVYVALPELVRDVGFSEGSAQWVISAYAVFFGGFLLLGGRSGDLLGRRRMFVLGMVAFGGASLLGGLATSPGALVAARAIQGVGAAIVFPATLAQVNTMFGEGRRRLRALGVWAMAGAGGLSAGALLGGLLTHAFGWEAVFLVNVPLVVAAAAAAFWLLPADGPVDRGHGYDLPGVVTGTAGATLLVYSIAEVPDAGWTSPRVVVGAALALGLLAAFLAVEARSRSPLMPLRLLRDRDLAPALAIIFVFGATMQNVVYFLTLYFQDVLGYTALRAGLAFLGLSVVIALGNFVAGRLMLRIGIRGTLLAALLLGAGGSALLAAGMVADGSYLTVLAGIVVYGMGMGTIYPTQFAAAATGVDAREQGIAGGMANTAMQIGVGVGLAVLVGVAASGTGSAGGLRAAVTVSAGLTLLGGIAALALPGRSGGAPGAGAAGGEPAEAGRSRSVARS